MLHVCVQYDCFGTGCDVTEPVAEQLHVQLLPSNLRRLVAELGPTRRGAGGRHVLRDRQPSGQQPGVAAMASDVGVREGAGTKQQRAQRHFLPTARARPLGSPPDLG